MRKAIVSGFFMNAAKKDPTEASREVLIGKSVRNFNFGSAGLQDSERRANCLSAPVVVSVSLRAELRRSRDQTHADCCSSDTTRIPNGLPSTLWWRRQRSEALAMGMTKFFCVFCCCFPILLVTVLEGTCTSASP